MRPLSILLSAALFTACDDGDTQPEIIVECCCDDDDTGSGTTTSGSPVGYTTVEEVDLGVVCGSGEASVPVANDGDAVLVLSQVSVSGGDWELLSAPTEIDPGTTADIQLSGSDGTGILTIQTNDPSNPTILVHLSASADQPPSVDLDAASAIIAPGAIETLTGSVSDDDGADSLSLSWSSDVDGVLSTDGTDSTGAVSLDWDGAIQSSDSHTVTLTATDACGNTASDDITFCQNEGYTEENIDLASWEFTGNAEWDKKNSWVELTNDSSYQRGTAFQTSQTVSSDSVSIRFLFYAGVNDSGGADGLTLTAIDTTRMTTYQGASGGSIGYGGLPGWTVEVDTWYNSESSYDEPTTADHVSFVIDGDSTSAGEISAAIHEVEDGLWHEMEVEVDGIHVTVKIDSITYLDDDVPAIVSFPAHVGFTAATGGSTNYHLIDALNVEGFICE
ncbi:MAG: hypothetical protein ACI8RZ_005115 [Myxococcota bacterium]|jgi:hypothetical protein